MVMSTEEITKLIKDLREGDEKARKRAVFKLGELKAEEAVPDLIKAMENDPVKPVRRNAASALGKIGNPSAVEALCRALEDGDYYVRLNAARALGKIGDKKALPSLLNLIKNGGGKVYTVSGSDTEIPGKVVADESLKLEGMKYMDVQITAIKAVGKLGDESAVDILLNELKDEEGTVRCAVINALAEIGSKKAVKPLIHLLATDKIWYVRRDAAIALGKLGDFTAAEPLVAALDDKYKETAEEAGNALKKLGKKAVALAFILKPRNEIVRGLVKDVFDGPAELKEWVKKLVDEAEGDTKNRYYAAARNIFGDL